jgi:S-adenosylmethionine decarboxylase
MTEMDPAELNGGGVEWVIDARGCDPRALADREALERLFNKIIQEMELHPAAEAQWRQFPVTHGVTGLLLLKESHLTVHTFPEHGTLCLNLFCCRVRAAGEFVAWLSEFQPEEVEVRRLERRLSRRLAPACSATEATS